VENGDVEASEQWIGGVDRRPIAPVPEKSEASAPVEVFGDALCIRVCAARAREY